MTESPIRFERTADEVEFLQLVKRLTPEQQAEFKDFLRQWSAGMSFAEACMALGPGWDQIITDVVDEFNPR